jgi:hypothetical protein
LCATGSRRILANIRARISSDGRADRAGYARSRTRERVATLAAIIQILLESIRAGNAHDVVAELYDVIEEDFEQPLQ